MSIPKQLTVKDVDDTIRDKANIPTDMGLIILMGEQRIYD
jgi:hypothetical protein